MASPYMLKIHTNQGPLRISVLYNITEQKNLQNSQYLLFSLLSKPTVIGHRGVLIRFIGWAKQGYVSLSTK